MSQETPLVPADCEITSKMGFGDHLRRMRTGKNLEQRDVVNRVDELAREHHAYTGDTRFLPQATLSTWERGTALPRETEEVHTRLALIERVLGTPENFLRQLLRRQYMFLAGECVSRSIDDLRSVFPPKLRRLFFYLILPVLELEDTNLIQAMDDEVDAMVTRLMDKYPAQIARLLWNGQIDRKDQQ